MTDEYLIRQLRNPLSLRFFSIYVLAYYRITRDTVHFGLVVVLSLQYYTKATPAQTIMRTACCSSKHSAYGRKIFLLVLVVTTFQFGSCNFFVTGFVAQRTTHYHRQYSKDDNQGAAVATSSTLKKIWYHTSATKLAGKSPRSSSSDDDPNTNTKKNIVIQMITKDPKRSIIFSLVMSICGAGLGPFLDSYHSAFGVLKYNEPIQFILWGSEAYPGLTTAWWVPELFGLAGFLIGWLYIILDAVLLKESSSDEGAVVEQQQQRLPSPPKIFAGISIFTFQYWLSGILVQNSLFDRTGILNLMSVLAAIGFLVLDGSMSGLIVSLATCFGGPLIEAGLITATNNGILNGGYHYTDLGETGFFPLWIIPVYFLGGPANGNLARGFWNALSDKEEESKAGTSVSDKKSCSACQSTRRNTCPNCDGVGTYVATGGRTVKCTSCSSRGYVMCRSCFDLYDEDPYDIKAIRETMSRMPD
jgi:hypothetical protein